MAQNIYKFVSTSDMNPFPRGISVSRTNHRSHTNNQCKMKFRFKSNQFCHYGNNDTSCMSNAYLINVCNSFDHKLGDPSNVDRYNSSLCPGTLLSCLPWVTFKIYICNICEGTHRQWIIQTYYTSG